MRRRRAAAVLTAGTWAASATAAAAAAGLDSAVAAAPLDGAGSTLRVAAALAFTLAIVVGLAALLRRSSFPGGAGSLRVEQRLSVARGGQVAVVHVDGKRLLVGITQSQVNLIAELRDPPADPAASEARTSFDRILTSLTRWRGDPR